MRNQFPVPHLLDHGQQGGRRTRLRSTSSAYSWTIHVFLGARGPNCSQPNTPDMVYKEACCGRVVKERLQQKRGRGGRGGGGGGGSEQPRLYRYVWGRPPPPTLHACYFS